MRDKYFVLKNNNYNLITYFHISKKVDSYSYSVTIDEPRQKVCSVKPLTKSRVKRIETNEDNFYTECTKKEWKNVIEKCLKVL